MLQKPQKEVFYLSNYVYNNNHGDFLWKKYKLMSFKRTN